MAKTNPYTSRQSAALAFDGDQADEYPRTPVPRFRGAVPTRPEDSSGRGGGPVDGYDAAGSGAPLRSRRRAPIPQGRWAAFRWSTFLFRTRSGFALLCLSLLSAAVLLVLGYRAIRGFLEQDAHFRIASSASIQIAGVADSAGALNATDQGGLTRSELLRVFGGDIGRNIFFVPLAKRRAELEQLPWVAHATVMRLLPDRLSVSVVERVPIAFVRLGSRIGLVDAEGVLLTLPPATLASRHYSFPVVAGLTASDPPQARAARMQLYQRFVGELDGRIEPASSLGAAQSGAEASPQDHAAASFQSGSQVSSQLSSQLSEVDLADLEDVRAIVPAQGSDILLHFGDSDFLTRYRSFQAHLPEWRQQYPHLSAIDLRYDRQVVLKMADGAESEASSVDHGASLTAAPPTTPRGAHASPKTAPRPAHHAAGHGAAHGWRPL